jgi:hypothetical protein
MPEGSPRLIEFHRAGDRHPEYRMALVEKGKCGAATYPYSFF